MAQPLASLLHWSSKVFFPFCALRITTPLLTSLLFTVIFCVSRCSWDESAPGANRRNRMRTATNMMSGAFINHLPVGRSVTSPVFDAERTRAPLWSRNERPPSVISDTPACLFARHQCWDGKLSCGQRNRQNPALPRRISAGKDVFWAVFSDGRKLWNERVSRAEDTLSNPALNGIGRKPCQ